CCSASHNIDPASTEGAWGTRLAIARECMSFVGSPSRSEGLRFVRMTAGKFQAYPPPKPSPAKIKRQPGKATARTVRVPVLEPEGRTEGNFKVIVRAVIEVNFVARFKAQADRTPESLDSPSGIHGETCVPGLNSTQGSHEPCGRVLIGNAKIHEAELAGDIGPERSRAGLEFGSKQPVQGTRVRVYKLRGDAV